VSDPARRPSGGPPPILPGATIGILGGGQLGRMLALAARPMGYRIAILDPDPECPAAAVADEQFVAVYDDVSAAEQLAAASDVVTYELEHVGLAAARAVEALRPLRPGAFALSKTQDRLAERRFLDGLGIPVAPWREVRSVEDLRAGAAALGAPLRLKVAIGGYDGRRQVRIGADGDLASAIDEAWTELGPAAATTGLVLEREVAFRDEVSVVIARDAAGVALAYPVARNVHDRGILVESDAPAPGPPAVATRAVELATTIATALDATGVITVEMFAMPDGAVLVNELAPRVHNSGHLTMELCRTSQFEQHVRAICGLPLGSIEQTGAGAAMVNLLGTGADRPARLVGVEAALRDPGAHLHVYGKRRVFERRKMGHVTVVSDRLGDAMRRARTAAAELSWLA
jgi:5-(carboxyamino)imidazole ribonucleotide synthase